MGCASDPVASSSASWLFCVCASCLVESSKLFIVALVSSSVSLLLSITEGFTIFFLGFALHLFNTTTGVLLAIGSRLFSAYRTA